jgi:hypothetical protein
LYDIIATLSLASELPIPIAHGSVSTNFMLYGEIIAWGQKQIAYKILHHMGKYHTHSFMTDFNAFLRELQVFQNKNGMVW